MSRASRLRRVSKSRKAHKPNGSGGYGGSIQKPRGGFGQKDEPQIMHGKDEKGGYYALGVKKYHYSEANGSKARAKTLAAKQKRIT